MQVSLRTCCFAILSAVLSSACCLQAEAQINWQTDLSAARRVSQQYGVPILVHFYGDNCLPCKTLEQNVFSKPEVASTIQKYFVPVHINATSDRKTAAEYGVHSWPTDVFLGPDGKTLTQGVCSQNPAAYIQNLQNVAVMNRDRNVMLAGHTPAAPQGSQAIARQSMHGRAMQGQPMQGQPGQPVSGYGAPAGSPGQSELASSQQPYGHLTSATMQDAAPGRTASYGTSEGAPSPYSNASGGASPYGQPGQGGPTGFPSAQLGVPGQSSMPNPIANAQTSGRLGYDVGIQSGPLMSGQRPGLVEPTQAATNFVGADPNIPQPGHGSTNYAASRYAGSISHPTGPAAMPGMPSLPAAAPQASGPASNFVVENGMTAERGRPTSASSNNAPDTRYGPSRVSTAASTTGMNATVENPHFSLASRSTRPGANSDANLPGASALPVAPAIEPALEGYCPVTLFTRGEWVEGDARLAVRHRGKVYYLASEQAAQAFLAAPDTYCPVLSGFDPLIYLAEGKLVSGSVQHGLTEGSPVRILLFACEENKVAFARDYARNYAQLELIVNRTQATQNNPAH